MNSIKHAALSLLILITFSIEAIENSIIPLIERFECLENLPSQKFTKKQLAEISTQLERKAEKIRLVTYNMLFDLFDHNLEEENRWPNRLPRIVNLLKEMRPDIICTQELYPNQVQDLNNAIGEDFAFFAGQKDEGGESYGIFYRKERFQLLSSQMIAALSMIHLKDLITEKTVYVFNTHMPLSNIEKRESNAHLIFQLIEPFAENSATLFTGDLNTFPTKMDMGDLPFYDGDYIHRILSKGSLKDSHHQSLLGHFGPISTFTNNSPDIHPFKGVGTPGIILDYIYISKKVTVLAHGVEQGTVDNHYPSDHMPVLIDFFID